MKIQNSSKIVSLWLGLLYLFVLLYFFSDSLSSINDLIGLVVFLLPFLVLHLLVLYLNISLLSVLLVGLVGVGISFYAAIYTTKHDAGFILLAGFVLQIILLIGVAVIHFIKSD